MWQLVMNGGNTVSVNFGYWKFWKMLSKNACKKIEDLIVKILKEFNYFGHDWAPMLHIKLKSVTKLHEVVSSVLRGELSRIYAGKFITDHPLLPSIRRRKTATFDRGKGNGLATEFDKSFGMTSYSMQVPSHVYFSEPQTICCSLLKWKSLALTLEYEIPVKEHLGELISLNLPYHVYNEIECDCSSKTYKSTTGVPVFSKLFKTKMLPPQSSNIELEYVSLLDQQSQKARNKLSEIPFTQRKETEIFRFSKSNQETLYVYLKPSKDQESADAESLTSVQRFWDCVKYTQPRYQVPTSTVSASKSLRPHSLLSSCTSILLFSMLIFSMPLAISGFSETPTSQVVSAGEGAEFRCQYNGASYILWTVNGSYYSPPGSITENTQTDDGLLSILTIPALPEYNGTLVQCVATISNGTSTSMLTSPTAVMLVIGYTTTPPPTTPPPTTPPPTTQPPTTQPPPTTNGFVEEPLSLNVTIGEEAVFRCEHRSAEAIFWRINGTSLSSRPDLNGDFNDDIISNLTVTALTKYNNTLIQCVALFVSDNSQPETTAPVILKMQGALNRVDLLVRNFTTLSWKAPFSLDLTNVEPDIAYCVDVYNITCGGRELLISDCDVTETSYTSDVIAPDGYIYQYIVTPSSNVEGAVNGTPSQPLREYLPTFFGSSSRLSVENFGQDSNVRAYQTELTYSPDKPIPSSYSLSLQSLDGLEDLDHVETTATIEPSVLTLEVVSGLPFRRLWNCTVLAYGCKENSILNDVLSTHDFRDILSSSLHPGQVRVTGSFTDDSTATGVLVIVIGDSEMIYHKASRDGTDKIKETLITGLAGGEYSISVFVVEENGLPFERVATSPKLVAVETNDVVTRPSSSIEYSLQSTSTGVCITCTFLDSSATDCVVVVHQRISQLSSSGLMNIESSHKLTRSGDTASGCIEGVNMEDYQVGVVGGKQVITVTEKSNLSLYIVIMVTVMLVLLTLVVLVLIIFVCKRSQKKRMWHLRVHNRSGSSTTTTDHDTESGRGNEYGKCPLDNKEEVTVEMDSESTPPPLYSEVASPEVEVESITGHHQTIAPLQTAHAVDQGQPVYAETLNKQINAVAAPPVVDRKEYDQVTGFKNPEGLHYAIVGCKTKPQKTPLDNDTRDWVVYSELLHQVSQDVVVDDSNEKDNHPQLAIIDTPTSTPYTSSNLLTLLRPVVSKWKQLAEALSIDEDDIDDIFTNNETDEACLCDLLDRFITVHHKWVDVERALRKMEEEHLAERASQLYVLPKSVQPEMTDHLGPKVVAYKSKCQPEVESLRNFPTYRTKDNVIGNTSDSDSFFQKNDTLKSVAGLRLKSSDSGYETLSRHSLKEAVGDSDPKRNDTCTSAHDQQSINETATCLTDYCRGFITLLGTEETQQQITQSVQSEHEDGCYMLMVRSSLKVSHHLQMPKEEQQRLSHCKPVGQECLWQTKASVLAQDDDEECGLQKCQTVSVVNYIAGLRKPLAILRRFVVNRAHHLLEWLSGVHIQPVSTISIFSSACIGQWWLPYYQESVFKFASNLPVKLSRLMMIIFCGEF